jgi:hypothetical protein
MSTSVTPPGWAETLRRVVLKPGDFDSVSGDLLEEYRESIHPVRGRRREDLWYVTEVLGFASRHARLWGVLFGAAVVSRNALDWFAPPLNFQTRAAVSTYLGIGLLVASGFCAAWRSRSVVAGTSDHDILTSPTARFCRSNAHPVIYLMLSRSCSAIENEMSKQM